MRVVREAVVALSFVILVACGGDGNEASKPGAGGTSGSGGLATGGGANGGNGGNGGATGATGGSAGAGATAASGGVGGAPGTDGDWDGFEATLDCDDGDDRVYPGISVACTDACGAGTKTCGADGKFSACSCTPLCEATGNGKCYYISPVSGDDTNPGSYAKPWKTYLNITYYYSPPSTHVALAPGDVVYFLEGTYATKYACCGAATDQALYIRKVDGTSQDWITLKAYPGQAVHFSGMSGLYRSPIYILESSYIRVEGFEVSDCNAGGGIYAASVVGYEVRNTHVHDMDGVGSNNGATGIYLSAVSDANIHHNDVHDNFDHSYAPDKADHKQNMILFGGGNARVHHNHVYQSVTTPQVTNGGILYKHKSTIAGAKFEVDHNLVERCGMFGVGLGTPNSHIHHNLLVDSGSPWVQDIGGPTETADILFERNTIIGNTALRYNPCTTQGTGYGPVGLLTYRENVVVDQGAYTSDSYFVGIGTYASDDSYNTVVGGGLLSFGPNCYFNPDGLVFGLYAAGGSYGALGASLDLAGWQAAGYDTASIVQDPELDANRKPALPTCQGFGHLAE